jgi:uncharacterized membrane protein YkoI
VRKHAIAIAAVVACMAVGGTGVVAASGGSGRNAGSASAGASRLDDGKNLLPRTKVTEEQAIAAAQSAASGPLNEVDLEDYNGQLVFNVDVGAKDVKVDASTGDVLATPSDD